MYPTEAAFGPKTCFPDRRPEFDKNFFFWLGFLRHFSALMLIFDQFPFKAFRTCQNRVMVNHGLSKTTRRFQSSWSGWLWAPMTQHEELARCGVDRGSRAGKLKQEGQADLGAKATRQKKPFHERLPVPSTDEIALTQKFFRLKLVGGLA